MDAAWDAVGRECRVARIVTVRAIFIRHKHKNDRFRRYYAAGPTRHATSVFAARLGVVCCPLCWPRETLSAWRNTETAVLISITHMPLQSTGSPAPAAQAKVTDRSR